MTLYFKIVCRQNVDRTATAACVNGIYFCELVRSYVAQPGPSETGGRGAIALPYFGRNRSQNFLIYKALDLLKFVFFEKATKFDEISILLLTNKFMFLVSRYSFEHQSLLYFIYFVSDIRNVQNCVAILKLLNICAIKKSNFLGVFQIL